MNQNLILAITLNASLVFGFRQVTAEDILMVAHHEVLVNEWEAESGYDPDMEWTLANLYVAEVNRLLAFTHGG